MRDTKQGLTTTYNLLKDPKCRDACILALRELHEALDREVLAAYGWSDISVPPYCLAEDDPDYQAFKDEVIDRLFELNAKYAAEGGTLAHSAGDEDEDAGDEQAADSSEAATPSSRRPRPANDLRPPRKTKPDRTGKHAPPSKPPSTRRRGAA